jgi:outer membrane lipoprotein-sorting protein
MAHEENKKTDSASAEQNIWRIIMKSKMTKFAAAAAIIIAVLIGVNQFTGSIEIGATAFAQVLEQIEQAKTITWKTTFYSEVTSKDGKRTWIETETREFAYKSPGLYRDVHFDENGQIHHVTIEDAVNLKRLSLNPRKKTATIRELAMPFCDPRGAFFWEKEYIKTRELELVGRRQTKTGEVDVFRTAFFDEANNEDWSYDFWVDAKTKQLMAVYIPGANIYDSENDPARNNPPETEWFTSKPIISVKHDINFDAELHELLFSLEPPEDYSVEHKPRHRVTEDEMVDFLGILAEYNNKTFPDRPATPSSDKINEIYEMPEKDRTVAEQMLLETLDYYKMAGLNMMPTGHFVQDHTVEKSFRYLGKGVRLGDQTRIVCWYKLKGSNSYRAVYGDLSVREVTPKDLPLKVYP